MENNNSDMTDIFLHILSSALNSTIVILHYQIEENAYVLLNHDHHIITSSCINRNMIYLEKGRDHYNALIPVEQKLLNTSEHYLLLTNETSTKCTDHIPDIDNNNTLQDTQEEKISDITQVESPSLHIADINPTEQTTKEEEKTNRKSHTSKTGKKGKIKQNKKSN